MAGMTESIKDPTSNIGQVTERFPNVAAVPESEVKRTVSIPV